MESRNTLHPRSGHRMLNMLLIVVLLASFLPASQPAIAAPALANSSFESGNLNGWSVTSGHVKVLQSSNISAAPPSSITPSAGSYMALLSNRPGQINPVALAKQGPEIPWQVISGRGAPSTGLGVTLNGTLGQPMIGPSSGGGQNLGAGYWSGSLQAAEVADLAIEKQALAASVTAGEELTYAITVTNLGPDAGADVELLDLVPLGTHVVTMTADNPYSESEFCSLNGTCNLGTLPARVSSISLANDTPGQADGYTIARTATVSPGDLLPGSTIDDVNIAIEFEKIDHENCANPYTGGNPYNQEIVFYLTSPGGTRVVLVESQNNWGGSGQGATYSDNATYGGHVTVMFDDAAATLVGGATPTSGTFRPEQALSVLNGEDPFGTWTLTIGDDSAGDALCFAGFNLAVTAEADVEATVDLVLGVDPDYAGDTLVNQAQVSADVIDPDETNNTDQATALVSTEADLAVDKVDLADPVEPLEGYLYQVNVDNYGASDARDVVVVDTLGAGVAFSTASPGCTGQPGGQVITCTLDLLEAGESTFFLLAVTAGDVPSGTLLLNDVEVSSATPDPLEANNADQETTTVRQEFGPSADLAIAKTATPAQVPAGELVTYVLTVTNAGPLAATGVQVLEMIPANTELVSIVADNPDFWYEFCTLSGVCYLGTVYPNSTVATVTAVLRVDSDSQETSLTNVASVSGDQPDYYPDNNFDSAVVEVIPLTWADLALDKNATTTVYAGELITYTLAVWNLGPQPAAGMLVTDTLPPDVTLARFDDFCGVPAAGTVVCGKPLLNVGQAVTFTLVVTVDAGVEPGTSLENAAVVDSLVSDPNPSNNADTADTSVVGWTDLALDKTGPEWISKGGLVTYTIVVSNYGPSAAQSVDVKDDLPAEIDLVSATVRRSSQDPGLCGGPVCQVGDMAVGEAITVTVVGQAKPDLPANLVLTNTATVFSDTPEEDLSNNTDGHPVWVRYFSLYLPLIFKPYLSEPPPPTW